MIPERRVHVNVRAFRCFYFILKSSDMHEGAQKREEPHKQLHETMCCDSEHLACGTRGATNTGNKSSL